MKKEDLQKQKKFTYEIPKSYDSQMRVPVRVYGSKQVLSAILDDDSLDQLVNVASLPSVTWRALGMPDAHQGYSFPIGGVAATDLDRGGIISPGAVGFDINCGVRLLTTKMKAKQISGDLQTLSSEIFKNIPAGVGESGKLELSSRQIKLVLNQGASYMVSEGYGKERDLEVTEQEGCFKQASSDVVSSKAQNRGKSQLGTLGSGNHFLELQQVDQIVDSNTAFRFGLEQGQLVIMIHCGSRGLGHQVATDYSDRVLNSFKKSRANNLPDKELAYTKLKSDLGQDYFAAMKAAANYAWANRQLITYELRKAFDRTLSEGSGGELSMLYDVAHNIAKKEVHRGRNLLVHRKGATRAFGPERKAVPEIYRDVGQPVLIPGSMGSSSWILRGSRKAEKLSFGSTCHGAGRRMSRNQARKKISGQKLKNKLEKQGLVVRASSMKGLAEEGAYAYKDISNVVDTVDKLGLAKKVAKLRPLSVIKG